MPDSGKPLLLLLLPLVVLPLVRPLFSRLIFGILGSTDTSTHTGLGGAAFLAWDCGGAASLPLGCESGVEVEPRWGGPTPLVPRWPGPEAGLGLWAAREGWRRG